MKAIDKLVRCGKRFDDDLVRYVFATESGKEKLRLNRLRENMGFRFEVEVKWEKWERFEIEDVEIRFKSKLVRLYDNLAADEPRLVKGVIYCTIERYKYRLGDVKEAPYAIMFDEPCAKWSEEKSKSEAFIPIEVAPKEYQNLIEKVTSQ